MGCKKKLTRNIHEKESAQKVLCVLSPHSHNKKNNMSDAKRNGSSNVPFDAGVEPVPVDGRVGSSDVRTSAWYNKQSSLLKGKDAITCVVMSSLKRKLEEMEDTMLMAESVFNSSLSSQRKSRLVCRISTDIDEKMEKQYGSPACTCNEERM
jgi:hypothetical protein